MSLVVQFLSSIRGFVLELNGNELRNWLLVENDVASIYFDMSNELKRGFPANSTALEKLIDRSLPQEDNVPEGRGSPWPGFNSFIKEYLEYWRDVDFADVVRLHSRLSDLLKYDCCPVFLPSLHPFADARVAPAQMLSQIPPTVPC